jgi:hypothetical protein
VEFKFKIKNYYSLELYIARKNNKLSAFEKLWGPLKYVFPNCHYLFVIISINRSKCTSVSSEKIE